MDEREPWLPIVEEVTAEPPGTPAPEAEFRGAPGRRGRGRMMTATIVGSLLVGGVAGAAAIPPLVALAASPSGATTTPESSSEQTTGSAPGNHVSDEAVVAKAIGITEADLSTALQGGKTIAQVAAAHNVSTQTVINALLADDESEIAADLSAGRITQAQAATRKTEAVQRATAQVNGTFRMGPGGPGDHVGDAAVVAKAIGISEADLSTALQGGKTIAQVAAAHNVSTQTVINALLADDESEIAADLSAGRITQAQAATRKTEAVQRATAQVNGTFRMGPGGPDHHDANGGPGH